MCLICVEFDKGKLTVLEALQNLSEMEESMTTEHYATVVQMLQKELETQALLESQEGQDDLTDEEISDRVNYESPWGDALEYGNFDESFGSY